MKNSTYKISILALILAAGACSQEQNINEIVAALNQEKDSLKVIYDEVSVRISEIDLELADLDSTTEGKLMLVTTKEMRPKEFQHFFEVYGEVHSDKNVTIFPEVMGLITSVNVKEGDRVGKGHVLARIDGQIIANQLKELETSLKLATTVFEKQDRLWKLNIGSEIQYLEAKNRKESLESSMSTLQSQLAKTVIKAPFSGTVDEIFLHAGEMASGQIPMLRLVNTDRVYLKSDVSEQHLNVVKRGTDVEVVFPSTDEALSAKISEVGSFINPENRTFKVKVSLESSDKGYRPNLLANMKIKDYSVEAAIVVSSTIIQQSADGSDYVYLLQQEGSKYFAKKAIIKTGKEYRGEIEILEGLKDGDIIIEEGARSVRDGQRVRI